jgi:hypothetical protein
LRRCRGWLRPHRWVVGIASGDCAIEVASVLVFSRSAGFRHLSIVDGVEAIKQLGEKSKFNVVTTDDPAFFNEENLKHYDAALFLHTTGNVLPLASQRVAFENYIRAGGGVGYRLGSWLKAIQVKPESDLATKHAKFEMALKSVEQYGKELAQMGRKWACQ